MATAHGLPASHVVAAVVLFDSLSAFGALSQVSALFERLEECNLLALGGILVVLPTRASLVPLASVREARLPFALDALHDRVLVHGRMDLPRSTPRP